jgi:hypothetical protein
MGGVDALRPLRLRFLLLGHGYLLGGSLFIVLLLGCLMALFHIQLQGPALLIRKGVQVEFQDLLVLTVLALLHNLDHSSQLFGGQVLYVQA